jgi:purine-nucleoside phosphorylase
VRKVAKKYEIELQFFRKSGKYYTSEKFYTDKEQMYELVAELNELTIYKGMIMYVNTLDHPNGNPMLILNRER